MLARDSFWRSLPRPAWRVTRQKLQETGRNLTWHARLARLMTVLSCHVISIDLAMSNDMMREISDRGDSLWPFQSHVISPRKCIKTEIFSHVCSATSFFANLMLIWQVSCILRVCMTTRHTVTWSLASSIPRICLLFNARFVHSLRVYVTVDSRD
jgi:hypothetical protein